MRQMNFEALADELSRKPRSHITQEDAREIQAAEVSIQPCGVDEAPILMGRRAARSTNHLAQALYRRRFDRLPTAMKPWDFRRRLQGNLCSLRKMKLERPST